MVNVSESLKDKPRALTQVTGLRNENVYSSYKFSILFKLVGDMA